MMHLNKYEKALWDLTLKIGPRKEYGLNGYFLTEEEANEVLAEKFNLDGFQLTHIRLKTCYGDAFYVAEISGDRRIIPRRKLQEYLH